MLKFLSSIWNRVRSFFRRILNYGNHNNAEHKNTYPANTFETDNSNIGKDIDNGQLTIHEAIEQNHWKEALELINKAQPDELNATNELGQTPLHLAVAAKHLGSDWNSKRDNIINALIERRANVNAQDKDGETAVHYISRWLLNNRNDEKVKCQLLHDVSRTNDYALMSALQYLIKNMADVNIKNNEGYTALDNITKAEWNWKFPTALSVTKILLEAGAHIKNQEQAYRILKESINKAGKGLKSSNHVKKDDVFKIVNHVMSNGITSVGNEVRHEIDINYEDKEGNTALSLAYKNKRFDVIKFLVEEKGADTNIIIPSTKKSFIIHVIEENLFDYVPSLKFDVVLENGLSPLAIAVNSNNYDSVKLFIEKYKVDINFSDGFGRKAIHCAAAGGNTKIVDYLIRHKADVNSFDGNGSTALHYAAANKSGNQNIPFLIKKGIGVNCEDSSGVRPIRFAIENNHLANLQILLDNGASLEMKDFEGVEKIDPSIVVALLKSKNCSIVQDLLKSGRTNLDEILKVSANDNYTILHWAAINNRPDIFAALELYIKDVHINDKERVGHTPLHFAVHNNNVDVVKILLKIPDIDINASLGSNYLPNSSIECARNAKMVFMLIEAGADIKGEKGKKSLVYSMLRFAKNGDSKSLDTLLSHGPLREVMDINAIASIDNYNNVSMLQIAAWQGDIEMLTMLAKYKPNVNLKLINEDGKGKAILHYIAEKHSKTKDKAEKNKIKDTMILLVLLFNADLTLTDKHGKKPLDYLSDPELKKELEEDVAKLRANINKTYGTSATDFILPYLKDNSDISTTLKSLNQLIEDVTKLNNVVNENIEKYTFKLFEERKCNSYKKNLIQK